MENITEAPQKKKPVSYRYEAVTGQGKTVKGTIKATGEINAERLLIEKGYRPVNVELVPSMFALEEALPTIFGVKPRDVIVFSRQLATLLRSGISLLPALEILQGQTMTRRAFRSILNSVIDDIRGGGSFSQALTKHPKAFSEIYHRTIAIGEQSGNMELVLNRMADYLEKQGEIAKKIGGALTYPMMILSLGVVVGVVLMTVVMPPLLDMFITLETELPLPTKILIGLTNAFSSYPLQLLITGGVLVVVTVWMVKQPAGRRLLDRLRLSVPIIGPPLLMAEIGRFSRTMSVLVESGLSLQEIMEVLPQSTNNQFFRNAINQVKEGLQLGEGLSGPMSRVEVFPPLLVQMVSVGEESNTLDFTLGVVADFYEANSEERMTALVGMIGPLSTIAIAGMVGFLAMAILMPMYTITDAFG